MIDNLTICPKCKVQDSCYIVPINEFHNSYTCFNCGFQTNDLMREGEFNFEEFENEMPEYDFPVHKAYNALSEEEKETTRFKGKTYKSDSKTLENFGQDGYFDACDYIGLFDINN